MNKESDDVKLDSMCDEKVQPNCVTSEFSPLLNDYFQSKIGIEQKISSESIELKEINTQPQQPLNINDAKILEIHKEDCLNDKDLRDFVQALWELNMPKDVINASIKVSDDLMSSCDDVELTNLGEKFKHQSIVIQLSSINSKQFTIYWKLKELNYFLVLKSSEKIELDDAEELYKFMTEFIANSLKCEHLGLNSSFHPTDTNRFIDITDLADTRDYNLLLMACEAGNLKIATYLCRLGITNVIPNKSITAQDVALKNGHFDIIQALYEENLPLPIPPPDVDMDSYSEKFMDFITILEEFFRAIEVDNLEQLIESYQKLPKTRHIYNFTGCSALHVAVVSKSFKSYEFLLSQKHKLAPNEDPEDLYDELEYQEQLTVREIHNRHAQESPKNHINVLMAKSFIVHDEPDVEQKLKIVRRAYQILNRNVYIRVILMIVAASKNFKIIFDFHRESINVADPTVGSNTQGIFYKSGRIYIGAKQLLDNVRFHEALSTIAHELCHFAINLVYNNNAKPYKSNDNQTMQEFEDISQHCKANADKEAIIKMAYDFYTADEYHAELIVRVVHIMAFYFKKPQKLNEVRVIFDPLFDFFELKVIPEMKEALPEIEKRVDEETKLKDKKIVKFRKIAMVAGFLAVLGILGVIFVAIVLHVPDYKFDLLSEDDQQTVMNGLVVYKDVEVRFGQLFPKGSIAYDRLTSEHISDVLKSHKLNFSDFLLLYLDEIVVHNWTDMAANLQKKVLSSDLIFQNETVKYEALHELAPDSFNFLTSNDIIQILDGNQIRLGKMIQNRTEFYLDRIFWNEHLLDIYKIYTKQNPNVRNWDNEVKFREFFDDFVSQNLSIYFQKLEDYNKLKQIKLQFSALTDNSLNVVRTFKSFHEHFEQILEKSQKSRIFVLSSEAGTGKTINFEQFAMKIKRQLKTKWVSYVDLKDYTSLYSEKEELLHDPQELLIKILDLTSKSEFELEIFKKFYKSGQVVLLWNGFDEISPNYNKFILSTLQSIQNTTSNIQFICTRPLYSKQLTEHLNFHSYTLAPLTVDEQIDFLNKFFISRHIQPRNYTIKAQYIIQTLKSKTSMIRETQEFDTPLMLEMIADLIASNTQIYNSENLYEIYEIFIKKKIEIWRKKSEFAVEFLGQSLTDYRNFDMIEMYQMYAFKRELKAISPLTQIVMGKLRGMRQKLPKNLTSVEVSRMAILHINGPHRFEFAHKTFAEFFVAQFFIENILNADNVDADDAVVILHSFEHFNEFYGLDQVMVTNFMFSYIEGKDRRKDSVEETGLEPKIRDILRNKFGRIFFNLIGNKPVKNFRFLFEFFKFDQALLRELLKVDENETVYTAAYNYAYFPDQINTFEIKSLMELGRTYLSNEDFEKFVNGKDQKGIILYSLYVFYRQDAARNGPRKVFHDKYDLSPEILESNDPIHVFEEIVKILTENEVRQLLTSPTSPIPYREFDLISNPKFWNISQSRLSIDDQKNLISNLIYGISKFNDPEPYVPILVNKTLEIVSSSDIFDIFTSRNILQRGILNFYQLWTFFVSQTTEQQQKMILTSKIVGECYYYALYSPNQKCYFYPPMNIFHISLLTQHPDIQENLKTFNIVKDTYEKYFTKIEMRNMILESNDFMIYTKLGTFVAIQAFVDYLKELFKGHEDLLKEFLLRKVHPTNFDIFEYFDNIGVEKSTLNLKLYVDLLNYVDKM
ncbi:uncharacterized protein [Chironomus tepperi]|uniref:uncharacterized protein n=1 Tax=Chironomus tepperi TaxID=113505 RepID=UPI00391F8E12